MKSSTCSSPGVSPNRFNFFLAAATMFFLAGCSDPADKVAKSTTGAPKEEATSTTSGKQYVIRAESTIGFVGSKVTGSHYGGFKKFAGTINVANGVVNAAEVKIDATSIWADNQRLTGHLKSADFFDVEKHPTATFTVTSIEPAEKNKMVTGNLELHGVTKSISFPADIQVADDAVTVKAEFAINRRDFGINYAGKANDLIRDNVVLKLDVKATPGEPRAEDKLDG